MAARPGCPERAPPSLYPGADNQQSLPSQTKFPASLKYQAHRLPLAIRIGRLFKSRIEEIFSEH